MFNLERLRQTEKRTRRELFAALRKFFSDPSPLPKPETPATLAEPATFSRRTFFKGVFSLGATAFLENHGYPFAESELPSKLEQPLPEAPKSKEFIAVERNGFSVYGIEKPIQNLEDLQVIYQDSLHKQIANDESLSPVDKEYAQGLVDRWFSFGQAQSLERREVYEVLSRYFTQESFALDIIITKSVWDRYAATDDLSNIESEIPAQKQTFPKFMENLVRDVSADEEDSVSRFRKIRPKNAKLTKFSANRIVIVDDTLSPKEQFMNGNRGLNYQTESPFSIFGLWPPDITDQRLYFAGPDNDGTHKNSYVAPADDGTDIDAGQSHEIWHMCGLGDRYRYNFLARRDSKGVRSNRVLNAAMPTYRTFQGTNSIAVVEFLHEPMSPMNGPVFSPGREQGQDSLEKRMSWADILTAAAFRLGKRLSTQQATIGPNRLIRAEDKKIYDTVMKQGVLSRGHRHSRRSFDLRVQPLTDYSWEANTLVEKPITIGSYSYTNEVPIDEAEYTELATKLNTEDDLEIDTEFNHDLVAYLSLTGAYRWEHQGQTICTKEYLNKAYGEWLPCDANHPAYHAWKTLFLGLSIPGRRNAIKLALPSDVLDDIDLLCSTAFSEKNTARVMVELFPEIVDDQRNNTDGMPVRIIGEYLTTTELRQRRQATYTENRGELFVKGRVVAKPIAQLKFPDIDQDVRNEAGLGSGEELHYVWSLMPLGTHWQPVT